jgi:hypothetical protein
VRLALGRCVPQPPRRPPVVPYSLPPLAYGVRPSNHCAPTRVGAWSRIAVPPFSSAPPRWSSPSVDAQPARSSRGRRWLWDLVAAPPPRARPPPPPPRRRPNQSATRLRHSRTTRHGEPCRCGRPCQVRPHLPHATSSHPNTSFHACTTWMNENYQGNVGSIESCDHLDQWVHLSGRSTSTTVILGVS